MNRPAWWILATVALLLTAPAAEAAESASGGDGDPVVARGHASSLPNALGLLLLLSGLASVPYSLWTLRWALLLPLFSRLQKERLLDSHARARILDLIQQEPGLGITDVCGRLQIGWGTAVHHLTRLEAAGLLTSQDSGRRRRFFHPSTAPHVRTAICVLSTDLNRRLLDYVRQHPGCSQTDACRALGLSAPLVHKYAQRLIHEGLLETRRQWRTVQYYVADSAASQLESYAKWQDAKGLGAPMGDA